MVGAKVLIHAEVSQQFCLRLSERILAIHLGFALSLKLQALKLSVVQQSGCFKRFLPGIEYELNKLGAKMSCLSFDSNSCQQVTHLSIHYGCGFYRQLTFQRYSRTFWENFPLQFYSKISTTKVGRSSEGNTIRASVQDASAVYNLYPWKYCTHTSCYQPKITRTLHSYFCPLKFYVSIYFTRKIFIKSSLIKPT